MRKLLLEWRRFVLCAHGATAAEYAVTLALIFVVAVAGFSMVGTTTGGAWYENQGQLSQALDGSDGATGILESGTAASIDDHIDESLCVDR